MEWQNEQHARYVKALERTFKDEIRKYERSVAEHQALLKALEERHATLIRKLDHDKDKEGRKTAEALAEASLAAGPMVEPPPVPAILKPPGV